MIRCTVLVTVGVVLFVTNAGFFSQLRSGEKKGKDPADLKPVTTDNPSTCFVCRFCAQCHCGPQEQRKGNKELDMCDLNSLLKTKPRQSVLDDYPAAKGYVVPGSPEQSLLWLRVKDGSMPSARGRQKPGDTEKEQLKKWISGLAKKTEKN